MNYRNIFVGVILVIVGSVAATLWYSKLQYTKTIDRLTAHYETVGSELVTGTKRLVQNDIDEETKTIIPQCDQQTQTAFDNAINSLANTPVAELDTTKFVYLACGYAPVQQKEVMLAKLYRLHADLTLHYEVLEQLGVAPDRTLIQYDWEALLAFETERAELFRELVDVQGRIIDLLQTGVGVNDPAVQAETLRASQIRDSSAVLLVQMNTLRSQLEAL